MGERILVHEEQDVEYVVIKKVDDAGKRNYLKREARLRRF